MSAISLKSITGITSITTPAGVDNQLTLHNNNTTEAVKLDVAGNLHFHNHLSITGVSTASNFKTGTSNLHNTGLNVQDLDVDGHTNLDNVSIAGVTTASDNIRIIDSKKLLFGDTNGDMKMYHLGGANSYIVNTANNLYIQSNNAVEIGSVDTNGSSVETSAKFIRNGAAELYHNDIKRLETSSVGVSIPQDLTVDGHTNLDNVSIVGITTITNINALRLNHATGCYQTFSYNGTARGYVGTGNHMYTGGSTGDFGFAGGSSVNIVFATANNERLRITSTGNLQFNTTANGQAVILKSTGNYYNKLSFDSGNTSAGGELAYIDFSWDGDKVADILAVAGSDTTNKDDGHLVFRTSASQGSIAEALRITSAGKVLIGDGTSITPSRNLDVRGTGHQQILLGSTNNAGVSLMLDGHGGGDGSGGNYGTVEMGSDGHLDIRNYDPAKNIVFGVGSNTGAEDTLILTSAGDLGLSNTGTNNPNNYSGWCTVTINGSSGAELDFEKGGSLKGDFLANDTAFNMTTRDSAVDINFATKNNAGSTANRLTISSEGNIRHVDGSGVSYFNGASEYVFGSASSSPASGGNEGYVQIQAAKSRATLSIAGYQNNAGAPFMQFLSSRSATVGSLSGQALINDYLGDIRFCGDNGSGGVATGATIQVRAKTAATTNGMAARIEFATAKDASSNTRQVFSMGESGAFTAESESPALYGYYTSTNNQNKYVDFPQWTRDSFICLEIFGNVNPNAAGSGAYLDPVHMYVYRGIGWTGSRLGYYIYCVSVAPPARHAFPSGTGYSGNAQISAVWTDGSSVIGNETATSTNYMRLQIPNANTTYNFPKQFRIFRRR